MIGDPLHLSPLERQYAERLARYRLHQPEFRVRILEAYGERCAVCRLGHVPLLDAAHIIGDSEDAGEPILPNGMSLCKIHHAAYDRNLMGITPTLDVHISEALLIEVDGPMLQHGLKEMHGARINVPTRVGDQPDRERLSLRYEQFLAAAI